MSEIDFNELIDISAAVGDSFYLLDVDKFSSNYDEFLSHFTSKYPKTKIGYSYKTNYIPQLCKVIDNKGGYAEVVSDMEYGLAVKLGVLPDRIIVNGPYKPEHALNQFLLSGSIVNIDNYSEAYLVEKIARDNPDVCLNVGLRCNFDIRNGKVSRFGFDVGNDDFFDLFKRLGAVENIFLRGIHCHFPDRDIDSYVYRVREVVSLAKSMFSTPPEYIDIGGGYFGKMDDSLKSQFGNVAEYTDYAEVIGSKFQESFGDLSLSDQPTLVLEPGSALVADTMKFVSRVTDIKHIRGNAFALTSGSRFNIGLLSSSINMPMEVMSSGNSQNYYKSLDVCGYTCIESDYLYRGYKGALAVGDFLVFSNVGSYSVVFKPPFILPNVAVLSKGEDGRYSRTLKRKETLDDIFLTYAY